MGRAVTYKSSSPIAELASNEIIEVLMPPSADILSANLVAQDKTLKLFYLGTPGELVVVRRFVVLIPGVETNLLSSLTFISKGVIDTDRGPLPFFLFELSALKT